MHLLFYGEAQTLRLESTNAAARHPRLQTKSPLDHEQSPKPNDEAYFLAEYAYANIACKYQPGHQTHVKTQHSKKSPLLKLQKSCTTKAAYIA